MSPWVQLVNMSELKLYISNLDWQSVKNCLIFFRFCDSNHKILENNPRKQWIHNCCIHNGPFKQQVTSGPQKFFTIFETIPQVASKLVAFKKVYWSVGWHCLVSYWLKLDPIFSKKIYIQKIKNHIASTRDDVDCARSCVSVLKFHTLYTTSYVEQKKMALSWFFWMKYNHIFFI